MAYDAFISYRHGADGAIAAAIERGLERLARPWNRLRAMSVFRDESELGAESDLTGAITGKLDTTRFMVLIASRESAASPWVDKEVTYWCDTHGGAAQIIVVLTGGEFEWDEAAAALSPTSTAISPVVRSRITTEPLYVDLRWAREAPDLSLRDTRFRTAIVRVAATIRGMAPADLESEDVRRHRHARRLARTAVATVTVLALVASVAAVVAVANSRRADRRARDAVARQVGLAALDLPASDVDAAFLLSLASADLDSDRSGEQFQASRVLIGRYSRLEKLLYAPEGTVSIRDIAISPSDGRIMATLTGEEGNTSVLTWADEARANPEQTDLGPKFTPTVSFTEFGEAVVGGPPENMIVLKEEPGTLSPTITGVAAVDIASGLMVTASMPPVSVRLAHFSNDHELASAAARSGPVDLRFGRAVANTDDGGIVVLDVDGTVSHSPASPGVAATDDPLVVVGAGPGGDTAAVTASTSEVVQWRRNGDRLERGARAPLPAEAGEPRQVVVAPDGDHVLIKGIGGSVIVSLSTGELVGADSGATGIVSVDPSGRYAAVGGARLTIWDLTTGRSTFSVPTPVNDMAWSGPCDAETSCTLATVGESLDAWQPESRRHIELTAQTNAQAVGISADGSTVVTAGWGPNVAVWKLRPIVDDSGRTEIDAGNVTGTDSLCAAAADGEIGANSPDGSLAVTHQIDDGTTTVCATSDGSVVARARIHGETAPATVVAVDDEGNIAFGGGDGYVGRFERDDTTFRPGTAIDVKLGTEQVSVTSLAYQHGTIAAGIRPAAPDAVARVFIWQVDAGETPAQFDTDHAQVPALALLGEDAKHVAVAGRDQPFGSITIQIWETASRRRLGHALAGLTGTIVALRGDEEAVTAADGRGAAYRWPLDTDPTRDICAIVGRSLTPDEWETLAGGALGRYDRDEACS